MWCEVEKMTVRNRPLRSCVMQGFIGDHNHNGHYSVS